MFIIFLILLVVGLYFLVEPGKLKDKYTTTQDPFDKLQERFVSGEIDEETYVRMKKILKESD